MLVKVQLGEKEYIYFHSLLDRNFKSISTNKVFC